MLFYYFCMPKFISMKIVTFLFSLLLCLPLQASPEYYVKQISLSEGLSHSNVKCIQDDYRGFIWVGTKVGLNRFDKQNVKQYFFDERNKYSLPNNSINFIAEDSQLNLWISTEGGVVQYNRKDDNFIRILYEGKPLEASSFLKVSDGIILGGSRLYKYDYSTSSIKNLKTIHTVKGKGAFAGYISNISLWKKNILVLSTRWNGVWLYNMNSCTLTPFKYCNEKCIQSSYIDSRQNLWLAPYSKGVLCYAPDGKLLKQYSSLNSRLSNDIILDIKQVGNNLWMGTDGGGICVYNMNTGLFDVLEHSFKTPNSLPVNSIQSLFYDRDYNIWAGSIRGGLLGIKKVLMSTYMDANLGSPFGLSDRSVISLFEDDDHTIWIGTDGGGLNQLNPIEGTFLHIPQTYKQKVVSITPYSKDELLISLFSKGLFVFNKKSRKLSPFLIIDQANDYRINNIGFSVNVYRFAPDRILILADQVYIYDMKLHTFTKALMADMKGIDTPVSSLHVISSNDKLTYLTGQNNIFEFNHSSLVLRSIFRTKPIDHINDVCLDNKGRFWMATSRGLELFDSKNKRHSIVQDRLFQEATSICSFHNMLWIGAKGMLFAYNTNENKFIILGEDDGASPNEFMPFSSLVSTNGDAYIGGVNGLLKIDNSFSFKAYDSPRMELMEVLLDGVPAPSVSTGGTLSIPWNNSSIVIKTLVRGKDVLFSKRLLRLSVSGLDFKDIESYDHTFSFNSLPQGTYKIFVSCNNRNGTWSKPLNILTIVVTPPWWKSNWFILLLFAIIATTAILVHNYLIRRKEIKLEWEMKEHKQIVYEEKVRFLINLSHELRTPLLLVYAPLKRMIDKNEVSGSVKEQLTSVNKHVKQMKNLINMVLDIRRMESGERMLSISSYPLNDWLKAVTDDFMNEFRNKNIDIILNLDPTVDRISFDKDKCEIICSNFLMNALKFGYEGTKVTITSEIIDNYVRISVSDQGIGLDGVNEDKLFTRFYKGDYSYGGTGIGLSYAKTLVELHKGRIGALNNSGPGATFFFELPLRAERNASPDVSPSLNELLSSTETENHIVENLDDFDTHIYSILIAEDNIDLSDFLKKSFAGHFKKIYTAMDGQQALQLVRDLQPDVVISDIVMPKANGYELLKAIKGNVETSYIPVVLLTSKIDAESANYGYKLGADAYLPKPFDLDSLFIIIRNQLKNREFIKSRYKKYGVSPIIKDESFSNTDEMLILKLNKIISENLDNPKLNVMFVAESLNMSRTICYDKLNPLIGMGVNEYINKCRIDMAVQMLIGSDLSIVDISTEVGFSNQQYFSKVFKKMTGMTPLKFREEKHKSQG